MPETLPTFTTRIQRLDPTCADVRIDFDNLPADVEVRGRLMGPRCPGVSTVEVAYSLRRLGPTTFQIIIPEPSLWSPEHPFIYEGPIDYLRGGQMIGEAWLSVGLKTP